MGEGRRRQSYGCCGHSYVAALACDGDGTDADDRGRVVHRVNGHPNGLAGSVVL